PEATTVPPEQAPLAFTLPPVGEMYAVQRELGRGGIGRVLVARDRRLGREVALKLLQQPAGAIAARFEREARITAHLQHPGIVPIYEAGRLDDGEPFYAMKLVSGRPFDAVLDGARAPAERLALLPHVVAVADALAYAHAKRIVHRDLKPQNIIVGEFGETVVIDWGLAKDLDDDGEPAEAAAAPYRDADEPALTLAGAVMGTPAYMAPEQARGEPVDERADVFAVGAVLYQLLAGRLVYPGRTVAELLAGAIRGDRAPSLRGVADLPPDLVAIVDKAIDPDRAHRYATASELAADLRAFTSGRLVGVHRYTLGQHVRRWVRKHRTAVAIGAVAACALAAVSVVGVLQIRSERATAVEQRDEAERQRTEAERQRTEAELANALMLEDQARRELAAGHATRALPFAAEAHRLQPEREQARVLAGEALRKVGAPAYTLRLPAPCTLAVAPGKRRGLLVCAPGESVHTVFALDLVTGAVLARKTDLPKGNAWFERYLDDDRVALFLDGRQRVFDAATLRDLGELRDQPRRLGPHLFAVRGRAAVVVDAGGAELARLDDVEAPALHALAPGTVLVEHGEPERRRVAVWDTATWKVRARYEIAGAIGGAAGDRIAVETYRDGGIAVDVADAATGRHQSRAHFVGATGVVFDGELARAVVTYGLERRELVELGTGRRQLAPDGTYEIKLAPRGRGAAFVTRTSVALSDGNRIVATLPHGDVEMSASGAWARVATGNTIQIHDLATGQPVVELDTGGAVSTAALLGEERVERLVAIVRLADTFALRGYALAPIPAASAATKTLPVELTDLRGAVADGRVAFAADSGLYVVDTASFAAKRLLDQRALGAAFLDGGRLLATVRGATSGTIVRIDPATGALDPALVDAPSEHGGEPQMFPSAIDVSDDRRRAVVTSWNAQVALVDTVRGTRTALGMVRAGENSRHPNACISPDGALVMYQVHDEAGHGAVLVDAATAKVRTRLATVATERSVENFALAISNTHAALGGHGAVRIFDTRTGALVRTVDGGARALAFDRGGARLAIVDGALLTVVDVATGARRNA
ncbi:MAG: serine/threonine protein kinase, partial [Deltaproteobacteria bacterium]|nr:serine/threonine protein kinase [Deltaproteobacteria bacterium]